MASISTGAPAPLIRHAFHAAPVHLIEHEGDLWMTGEDIGQALEYADPRDAIKKLFARNQEELENYSAVVKVALGDPEKGGLRGQIVPAGGGSEDETDPSGVIQRRPVRVFNEEGVMVLTMLSSQPKAREFRAWAVQILKAWRRGELALSTACLRETVLVTCIKEARFGNPVAVDTLIRHYGYPETIRREIRGELQRRAQRDPAETPELVLWFIEGFLPRLRDEIEIETYKGNVPKEKGKWYPEGRATPILTAIRNRHPNYRNWREVKEAGARWSLEHRASDLYDFLAPLAEAEDADLDVTSHRFTRWLGYNAARLKAAGWERVEHHQTHGWAIFRLRLTKGVDHG